MGGDTVGGRDGPRFTEEQRAALKARAWRMLRSGVRQMHIANELDVSQATVCRWIQKIAADQPPVQRRIAEAIRRELVCCDIYQRMEAACALQDKPQWNALRHSSAYHDICFYGEWAAQIAEKYDDTLP